MNETLANSLSFRPEGFGASSMTFRHDRLIAKLPEEDRLLARAGGFDADAAAAFTLFSVMLFILQLGTAGAALFVLITLFYAACRRRELMGVLTRRWYLLAFPLFAIASVLWSSAPAETLKHSGEFAFTTVAGMLLAVSRNPKSMLLGMFAAFSLYVSVSILEGNLVDVGGHGARALSGLNSSKNEEADVAAAGLLISAAVFAIGYRLRNPGYCLAASSAGAIQIYAVARALSTGAAVGLGAALVILFIVILLRAAGTRTRIVLLALIPVAAICAVAILEATTNGSALQWLAASLDKDPTLTGRTYLWFRARDLIAEKPLLGEGFAAFWQPGNLDAEGFWQFAQIATRQGFNFHNTLYDAVVSVGWIGAAILGLTLLSGLIAVAAAYVQRPALMACFWLSMAVYLIVRMPTECVGLNEFYFSTVLLFALLSYGGRVTKGAPLLRPAMPNANASVPRSCRTNVRGLPSPATARLWAS